MWSPLFPSLASLLYLTLQILYWEGVNSVDTPVPNFAGKALSFPPLSILAMQFFHIDFILNMFFVSLHSLEFLSWWEGQYCQGLFSLSNEMVMWFLSLSLFVKVDYIYWCWTIPSPPGQIPLIILYSLLRKFLI